MSGTPKQLIVMLQKTISVADSGARYMLRWDKPHMNCARAGTDGEHLRHGQWGTDVDVDIVAYDGEISEYACHGTLEDFIKRLRLGEDDIRMLALFTDGGTPPEKRVLLMQRENCEGAHEVVSFWRGGIRVPLHLAEELATIVEYLSAEIEDPNSEITEQVTSHTQRAVITIDLGDDYVDR